MPEEKTIIRVRKGVNGFKYSACDKDGYFIGNLKKLADARKYWKKEIKWGYVEIVRELDKTPDMTKWEGETRTIKALLKLYTKG